MILFAIRRPEFICGLQARIWESFVRQILCIFIKTLKPLTALIIKPVKRGFSAALDLFFAALYN